MRLAVVSDIHGNLPALKAVIADIGARCQPSTLAKTYSPYTARPPTTVPFSDDSTFLTEEAYLDRMIPAARDTVRDRLGAATSRAVVLCGHSHRQSITQLPVGPLI